MREIKFRAWDEKGKVMINHNKLFRLDTSNEIPFLPLLEKFTDHKVMQYTGLVDKNGREIYEGDILPYGYVVTFVDASDSANLGMSVGWYEQRNDFESFRQLEVGDELEVIGNIYENPELLEGDSN